MKDGFAGIDGQGGNTISGEASFMSLVGQLADLSLDDILKIIHLSRKSGHLIVHGHDQEWTIAFWQGEIVRLSSDGVMPALITELQRQSVLERSVLDRALELLSNDEDLCPETVLIDHFGVSPEVLQRISQELSESILKRLTAWNEGAFCFDLWEEEDALPSVEGRDHLCLGQETGRCVQQDVSVGDDRESHAEHDRQAEAVGHAEVDSANLIDHPVWIVDDDPWLRQELGAYLSRCGMTVKLFETAADFWISLKKSRVEGVCPVVVIDLVMPRLNGEGMLGGLELLEKVCSVFPDMRVLPLSDHRCPEAENSAWALGVPEIFSKPQNLDADQVHCKQALERFGQVLFAALNVVDAPAVIQAGQPQRGETETVGKTAKPEAFEPFRNSPGLHLLRGMLEELNNPGLGGGIILLVLRFASEVMNRAVIFSVKDDSIVGIGQFGVTLKEGETDAAIRNIVIPRDNDSILGTLLKNPHPVRTGFEGSLWDDFLCRALGGDIPEDIFLGPIFSEGRVVAILYGDNLPEHSPVGNTEALEIFLSQAGLAMEKALLEGRLHGSGC